MEKKIIETFRNCDDENFWYWALKNQASVPHKDSSNKEIGTQINYRKYKITIELVEEDNSILQKRLQDLWDISPNPHDYKLIIKEAEKLGFVLEGNPGSDYYPKWDVQN